MNTTTNMIQVRGAYYIPQFPSLISVIMETGEILFTNMSPFRKIQMDEFRHFLVYDREPWRAKFFNEIPDYLYPVYGFEKIQ